MNRSAIEDVIFSLQDKSAFVTGASSGIGLHLARVLANAGARVVLAARREDKIEAAVRELNNAGYDANGVFLDVTKSDTIDPAFDSAEKKLGRPVDILINNSGVIYLDRFVDQKEAEIRRVFDTNLSGAFLVAQAAARRMVRSGEGGAIVNVASTAGLRAAGLLSSYAASKAALIHLTGIMAKELAHKNIRVNAICPGNFDTDMHGVFADADLEKSLIDQIPQKRLGQFEDLNGATLLLVSGAGKYITGATIPIDGGQLLTWM